MSPSPTTGRRRSGLPRVAPTCRTDAVARGPVPRRRRDSRTRRAAGADRRPRATLAVDLGAVVAGDRAGSPPRCRCRSPSPLARACAGRRAPSPRVPTTSSRQATRCTPTSPRATVAGRRRRAGDRRHRRGRLRLVETRRRPRRRGSRCCWRRRARRTASPGRTRAARAAALVRPAAAPRRAGDVEARRRVVDEREVPVAEDAESGARGQRGLAPCPRPRPSERHRRPTPRSASGASARPATGGRRRGGRLARSGPARVAPARSSSPGDRAAAAHRARQPPQGRHRDCSSAPTSWPSAPTAGSGARAATRTSPTRSRWRRSWPSSA